MDERQLLVCQGSRTERDDTITGTAARLRSGVGPRPGHGRPASRIVAVFVAVCVFAGAHLTLRAALVGAFRLSRVKEWMVCWTRPTSSEGGSRRKKAVTVVPADSTATSTDEGVPPRIEGGATVGTGTHAHDGTPIVNGKPCCDACDGTHLTSECPVFKGKKRDKHKDAQKGKGPQIGGDGGSFTLRSARVVRQPGDGSCLFHSMAYGLGGTSATALRRDIADWIGANPRHEIAETPVSDWVRWDSSWCVVVYRLCLSLSTCAVVDWCVLPNVQ